MSETSGRSFPNPNRDQYQAKPLRLGKTEANSGIYAPELDDEAHRTGEN